MDDNSIVFFESGCEGGRREFRSWEFLRGSGDVLIIFLGVVCYFLERSRSFGDLVVCENSCVYLLRVFFG